MVLGLGPGTLLSVSPVFYSETDGGVYKGFCKVSFWTTESPVDSLFKETRKNTDDLLPFFSKVFTRKGGGGPTLPLLPR